MFELFLNGVVVGHLVVASVEVNSVGEGVRGDCAAPSAHVFRGHLPPFLCVLLGLVCKFLLLIHVARRSNFLVLCRALAFSNILDQLVHLGHPFIVFVEACDLAVQQVVLLVSHFEVGFEAVDVGAKGSVLVCKLHIEILLEVKITLHVGHFSVPEVKLAALLLVILFHQGNSLHDIVLTFFTVFEAVVEN